ncbi:DNA-directed RNA polymerase III subunit 1 [Vitis vinifera]|uniref:DNA-directed RNA polymerase n=1 Tax=Vitis vinifera TaxID=29760 RepID=A0A438G1C6_VITVI|nr:DNA-directed RNA polymerase III subunit 1 [Vitis vinifera]
MVKGRIERTTLGQVAKSIKIVLTSRLALIAVSLDMEGIQASQLSIDSNIVRESILRNRRIKLKQQHIKVLDAGKLEVHPQGEGIETVERAVINKDNKVNTGLQTVMGTEGVIGRETTSNHIIEVQQTLGIEAARKCIINEIQYTMASHGMSIDIRHMMLLADLMTFRGEVLGITRFGIQKMDKSVLMLASFEKTADHLFNASVSGRDDKIEGVSECIIMGIPMQLGTGILKVRQRYVC